MEPARQLSRRRIAVAVLVVLGVLVGVQLLDPFQSPVSEPVGDRPAGDEPAEVLRYAIDTFDATAYELTVTVVDDGDGRRFLHAEINYTERELYYEFGPADRPTRFYFHADGGWVNHPGRNWVHGGLFDLENRFATASKPEPYDPEAIRWDRVRVHNRSADALWLRVDGADQNRITNPGAPGEAYTLYELDPETFRLRRSVEYAAASDTVRNVYVFDGYGRTPVERPDGTRDVLVNLVSDLLR